ncbi:hypothetical protein V1520DRAFT_350379 [Lipomyces starkeyi]|uniref:Uncharacterized protein n=1 Tax=Lipomyces starkeyi NRRL Y-11557 TaxID=675824 RepID=A0A1E3Q1V3_LIPST|nr:hypothetical protein LIPSTDRAFT_73176 [Lipomyces starkeyi NRRL Y-11557]
MALGLWGTAGGIAFAATWHFVQVVLPSGLCQRQLKSSKIFVKGPYNTESLSDALRATYKVLIEGDGLLSSYSYQNSPHYQSAAIATGNPRQKNYGLYGTVLFMAALATSLLAQIVSYVEGDNSFRIVATALIFTISLYIGIIMKGSFKEDDAGCATVYFNATETNWVTSSDFAIFDSSERMEIPITWSVETLFLVVLGLFVWSNMLSNLAEVYRTKAILGIFKIVQAILMALSCGCYIVFLVLIVMTRRRTVPTIEVQLAQAVSDNGVDIADILKFDIRKVIRKFASDVAKEFASSGKNWMADSGVYYDFANYRGTRRSCIRQDESKRNFIKCWNS